MVLTLGKAGNTAVINGYAEWFRKQPWLDLKGSVSNVFAPIAAFPNQPAMQTTAQWAFLDPQSPWTPFIGKRSKYGTSELLELLEDESLLSVPAYCEYLLGELRNEQRQGSLIVGDSGRLFVKTDKQGTVHARPDPEAPPKPGTAHLLSMADLVAHHLSQYQDMPAYHLYWPKSRRKAELEQMQAALQARHKQ